MFGTLYVTSILLVIFICELHNDKDVLVLIKSKSITLQHGGLPFVSHGTPQPRKQLIVARGRAHVNRPVAESVSTQIAQLVV